MTIEDWEQVPDGKIPASELAYQNTNDDIKDPTDPSPPYEESIAQPQPTGPARLKILGATWGGVIVTSELQSMIKTPAPTPSSSSSAESSFETLKLNMHTLHTKLLPDPAVHLIKTLTVIYQYSTLGSELLLLNATQFAPQITVTVTPTAHEEKVRLGFPKFFSSLGSTPTAFWQASPQSRVEIVAVLYGTQRIQTAAVLEELARFFEGQRGQIRMTTGFFRTDPWLGVKKTWTVYFRFVGSMRGMQCVTGVEDGALEAPWGI
ncbi:hypothetical protein B0H63DRAFT_468042 [Podospora didyma]|uniref:Uncharacterized protein n=1 Tax=Podospora didyma TaxID=330526 RepID=A0AAE0NRY6_9PEZI|nr:hypothetical protein B0H63DRAFT_468042 [Podospora didyma]